MGTVGCLGSVLWSCVGFASDAGGWKGKRRRRMQHVAAKHRGLILCTEWGAQPGSDALPLVFIKAYSCIKYQ